MAAGTVQGKVYEAIAARTADMASALNCTVGMPNVSFTPPTRQGTRLPYFVMRFMPNGSALDGLPFDSDETHIGLLQLSVYWPADEGMLKPTDMASAVAGWWPAGLAIYHSGVLVSFDSSPTIVAALQESDLVQIPVTVKWRASEIKP